MTKRSACVKLTAVRFIAFSFLLLAAPAAAGEARRVVAVRPGEIDIAPAPAATLDQGVSLAGSRLLGSVVRVRGDVASVKLPVDVRVRVGDEVTLVDARGGGVDVIPTRLPGLALTGEIGVYAGFPGGYAFNYGGVQTVFAADAVYRFDAPVAVHARLEQVSLAFTSPRNLASADLAVGPTFDTDYFELGALGSIMGINDGSYKHADPAFALEPFIRFGAVDGLFLSGTVAFPLVSNAFRFGGGFGEIGFPIANRFWSFVRCGGSIDGFARLDLGVRALVRGNGDHGSVFLRFTFGGVATFFQPLNEFQIGPGGSVGVEVRP